jgi:hypothetical protein
MVFYDGFKDLQSIKIGNSREMLGSTNNGDIDDWILHNAYLYPITLNIAPSVISNNGKGSMFLTQSELINVFNRNVEILEFALSKASVQLK